MILEAGLCPISDKDPLFWLQNAVFRVSPALFLNKKWRFAFGPED